MRFLISIRKEKPEAERPRATSGGHMSKHMDRSCEKLEGEMRMIIKKSKELDFRLCHQPTVGIGTQQLIVPRRLLKPRATNSQHEPGEGGGFA